MTYFLVSWFQTTEGLFIGNKKYKADFVKAVSRKKRVLLSNSSALLDVIDEVYDIQEEVVEQGMIAIDAIDNKRK